MVSLTGGLFAQSAIGSPPGRYTNSEMRRLWKPVADTVYLQEIGEKVATDKPVTAVAVYQDSVYAVVGGSLQRLQDGVLKDAPGAPAGVKRLRSLGGAIWAAADKGTYRFAGDTWERVDERPFTISVSIWVRFMPPRGRTFSDSRAGSSSTSGPPAVTCPPTRR